MTGRVRVNQDDVTFRELGEVEELLGCSLADALEKSQARAMAALVWVIVRRDNPTFTYDEALDMKPSMLDVVSADPEALGGGNGVTPLPSPAPGLSTLPT